MRWLSLIVLLLIIFGELLILQGVLAASGVSR
jgi:hypothetical protein